MGIESQSEGAATNRLLIVDDEPDFTRIIEITARKLGFEVMSIHDSNRFEHGLEQLRPTIIFLDITMPDRDGLGPIDIQDSRAAICVIHRSPALLLAGDDEWRSDTS